MHNDGVVQGLSEVPFMQDVERWGVLTIGTGLGNARFTNRRKDSAKDDKKTITQLLGGATIVRYAQVEIG